MEKACASVCFSPVSLLGRCRRRRLGTQSSICCAGAHMPAPYIWEPDTLYTHTPPAASRHAPASFPLCHWGRGRRGGRGKVTFHVFTSVLIAALYAVQKKIERGVGFSPDFRDITAPENLERDQGSTNSLRCLYDLGCTHARVHQEKKRKETTPPLVAQGWRGGSHAHHLLASSPSGRLHSPHQRSWEHSAWKRRGRCTLAAPPFLCHQSVSCGSPRDGALSRGRTLGQDPSSSPESRGDRNVGMPQQN